MKCKGVRLEDIKGRIWLDDIEPTLNRVVPISEKNDQSALLC